MKHIHNILKQRFNSNKNHMHMSLNSCWQFPLATTREFMHTTLGFLVCIQPYANCVVGSIQPWKTCGEMKAVVSEFFQLSLNTMGRASREVMASQIHFSFNSIHDSVTWSVQIHHLCPSSIMLVFHFRPLIFSC